LREAAQFLEGEIKIAPVKVDFTKLFEHENEDEHDFRGGQRPGIRQARVGDRGGGRTQCPAHRPARPRASPCSRNGSRRFLPPLSLAEALETTKIHSIVGLLKPGQALVTQRPFRAPHHTASDAGLLGATSIRRRAKFRSRITAFYFWTNCRSSSAACWETMRQPLEEGIVTISRAAGTMTFQVNLCWSLR